MDEYEEEEAYEHTPCPEEDAEAQKLDDYRHMQDSSWPKI